MAAFAEQLLPEEECVGPLTQDAGDTPRDPDLQLRCDLCPPSEEDSPYGVSLFPDPDEGAGGEAGGDSDAEEPEASQPSGSGSPDEEPPADAGAGSPDPLMQTPEPREDPDPFDLVPPFFQKFVCWPTGGGGFCRFNWDLRDCAAVTPAEGLGAAFLLQTPLPRGEGSDERVPTLLDGVRHCMCKEREAALTEGRGGRPQLADAFLTPGSCEAQEDRDRLECLLDPWGGPDDGWRPECLRFLEEDTGTLTAERSKCERIECSPEDWLLPEVGTDACDCIRPAQVLGSFGGGEFCRTANCGPEAMCFCTSPLECGCVSRDAPPVVTPGAPAGPQGPVVPSRPWEQPHLETRRNLVLDRLRDHVTVPGGLVETPGR